MADLPVKNVLMGLRLGGLVFKAMGMDPSTAVMEALGIDRPDDVTRFTEAILPRLDAIHRQLDVVQRDMEAVRLQGTRIELSIRDEGFQRLLGDYNRSANVIQNEYDRWLSALAGLGSSSDEDRRQGARLLFEITSPATVNKVMEAMRHLETSLLGRRPMRGVFDYLTGVLDTAVQVAERPPLATICGRPVYDGFHALTQFRPRYSAAVNASLVPLFQSVLIDLHEGITLLELSALSIQRRQLRDRYAAIVAVCGYIAEFWTTHTEGPNLEAAMRRAFDAVGTARVDNDLRRDAPWADWSAMHPDPWDDGFPRHWRFPEHLGSWITVARRPDGLARSDGPGGTRGPLVSLIQPGFQFGTSVEQLAFREHADSRSRPWVSYGAVFDSAGRRAAPVAYPVPTPGELFGPGGPPPKLQAITDGIARLELLTAPE
jgi:hypothetical protein